VSSVYCQCKCLSCSNHRLLLLFLTAVFSGEVKDTWIKTLTSAKHLDSASKTYPNTVHGFGCRPDVNDAKVKAGYEESLDATAQFFTKVLV
jgi:hypothetical protein